MSATYHKLAETPVYTLRGDLMAHSLNGGPLKSIPAGTKIIVVPHEQSPDIEAKMKEAGLNGEFYLVGIFDTVLSLRPELYAVVSEELERRVFRPVEISGEPLSATVIRERR